MKKLYATLLAAFAALGAFNASAEQITLEVDNPEAVKLTISDNPVTFVDKVATIDYDPSTYPYLYINANDGYVLESLTYTEKGGESENSVYINEPTRTYLYLSSYLDGNAYKLKTSNLEALRTASFTLNVDKPESIKCQLSWTNEFVYPTQTTQEIKFVPGKETPISISHVNYGKIYSVKLDGQEVTESYGTYYVYGIENGSVIDIQVDYPDIKFDLTFNISEQAKTGFITSVKVDGTEISDWESTKVQAGSEVSVAFNTNDFNVIKFNKNGNSISSYGYYSPYTFTMSENTVFDIDAKPYGTAKMTINVDKAAYVILYKGYNSSDPSSVIALQDGATTFEVSETTYEIHLKATQGNKIISVTQDEQELSPDYSGIYTLSVKDGSVINVEAEEISYDKSFILYFDSPAKASDQSQSLYGYSLTAYYSRRSWDVLNEGYNVIKYNDDDGDFSFSIYNGNADNTFLYFNGEYADDYNGYYSFTPKDGDVLKCYIGEEPAQYNLTFDVATDVTAPEVTVDKVTKLDSLDASTVLPGTHVSMVPADGNAYPSVKVGEEEVPFNDGKYEFLVNNHAPVKISGAPSGIENIETENAETVIYNLQGIRVNKAELPAGIYIVNGKKTLVK